MRHAPPGTYNRPLSPAVQAALQRLADSANMIVWMTNAHGACIYLNPQARSLLPASEVLYQADWMRFVHPDDAQFVRSQFSQAYLTQTQYQSEYRVVRSDGSVRWVLDSAAPRFDEQGDFLGYNGTLLDVTAQHKALDDLEKSEQKYRLLAENASDLICHCDDKGQYLYVSPSYAAFTGIDVESCEKHNVFESMHPDDMERLRKELRRQIESGVEGQVVEVRKRHWSGKYVWVGSKIKLIFGHDKKTVVGAVTISRDITKERDARIETERLSAENKSIIENSLDIIAVLDQDGVVLSVNPAAREIHGYELNEILGRNYFEFLHSDDLENSKLNKAKLLSDGQPLRNIEARYIRKNGQIALLSSSVRWDAVKKQMYVIARDVTEVYKAKADLQRTNDHLNRTLESIGDAFVSIDNDWHITYANKKTASLLGIGRENLLGRSILEVIPGLSGSSTFSYIDSAMRARENTFFEVYYEPVGWWIEARLYPYDDGLSIFFQDITEKKRAADAIKESESRFREMIDLTPAGYIALDSAGNVVEVNPALCAMSGYSAEDLIGRFVLDLMPSCPLGGGYRQKGGAMSAERHEIVMQHKDGRQIHMLGNLTIKRDAEGNPLTLTAFLTDITERKDFETELEKIANHDALTGLPNRTLLRQRLEQMLGNSKGEPVAVMFIDLDRFKEVNDSMGHSLGDRLLQQVATRLKSAMRPSDIIARLGGDEFIVVAHCSSGRDSACDIASRLIDALTVQFYIDGNEIVIGASIGISMYPDDALTEERLFQNADTAMYHAKATDTNRYMFFERLMNEQATRHMLIKSALRRALDRNEFVLHYQPRVTLKTMSICGMEALIRWDHPDLGMISPAEFIPIAEDSGLIGAIGHWVLDEACRHTRHLNETTDCRLSVSVNLSAQQLRDAEVVTQVAEVLEKWQLPAELLELELTETALVKDMDRSADVLKKLKSLGVLLSVDDFGTGYSGLSYLKRFPMDILKLDRSFITQQPEGITGHEFIKALVDMAHALKLSVVAEGIENKDLLRLVQECACDEGQGYYLSKPMPFSSLKEFVLKHHNVE
ncbi:sensor domain-containing protein [Noviherbaspirillum pedocola]|uniref:PAS domain S-box protein n=1 Tax=Noviherbaspirillum pedocola TaxID=2801341 RepID=A0A934W3D3_9BURK|nr:PAS domain S-box protein [Noviherbaspirillum pedocola]MBK4737321.1 PAS domain S-box protein [Noviherbaspirillum pedocola]